MPFPNGLFLINDVSLAMSDDQRKHILSFIEMLMENENDRAKLEATLKQINLENLMVAVNHEQLLNYFSKNDDTKWKYPNISYEKTNVKLGGFFTLINYACLKGNLIAVQILLSKMDAEAVGQWTPHLAVSSGNLEIVAALNVHKIDFESSYKWLDRFSSPLELAIMLGYMDIFNYLCENQSSLLTDIRYYGRHPLDAMSFAILSGQYRVVNRLLELGRIDLLNIDSREFKLIPENESESEGEDENVYVIAPFDLLFDEENSFYFKFEYNKIFDGVLAVILQLLLLGAEFKAEKHEKNFINFLKELISDEKKSQIQDSEFCLHLLYLLQKTYEYQSFSAAIQAAVQTAISYIQKVIQQRAFKYSLKETCLALINFNPIYKTNALDLPLDLKERIGYKIEKLIPNSVMKNLFKLTIEKCNAVHTEILKGMMTGTLGEMQTETLVKLQNKQLRIAKNFLNFYNEQEKNLLPKNKRNREEDALENLPGQKFTKPNDERDFLAPS